MSLRWPIAMGWCLPLLTSSSQGLRGGQSLPNCSICQVRRCQIVNFMNSHPKKRYFWGNKWKIDIFWEIFFSTPGHISDKLSIEISNDDQERVFQICKFYDPRGRVGTIKLYSENALFLLICSSQLLDIQYSQRGSSISCAPLRCKLKVEFGQVRQVNRGPAAGNLSLSRWKHRLTFVENKWELSPWMKISKNNKHNMFFASYNYMYAFM